MTVLTERAAIAPGGRPLHAQQTLTVPSMGGSLTLRVAHRPVPGDAMVRARVTRDLRHVARRVDRWAARLTRYAAVSDLSVLNADAGPGSVPVPPTLTAVLAWAERAAAMCPDLVDVTLLDERLAAETDVETVSVSPPADTRARWHLVRRARGGLVVRRARLRFDLDGVAKGWIADRALAMLRDYPAAMVDADGDIALRLGDDVAWDIGVADPRSRHDALAILRLDGRLPGGHVGVATSGRSVHRWPDAADGWPRHHLLDPRTRRSARTDVVQATVLMATAREAEILAKAVVVAGSKASLGLLDRHDVKGAVLLLDTGQVMATERTEEWLV